MAVAAPLFVENALKDNLDAPPGHRFRLYFDGWVWKGKTLVLDDQQKKLGLAKAARIDVKGEAARALDALRARQMYLAQDDGAAIHTIDAVSTAPFVTGVGMEHPLENGFAFFDPHGLPYLPGSGIKGVIRRAAEELALHEVDSKGWTIGAVWALFGFDGSGSYLAKKNGPAVDAFREHLSRTDRRSFAWFETLFRDALAEDPQGPLTLADLPGSNTVKKIHYRGGLEFWDSYPKPNGDLRADVITPHFGHYFGGRKNPTDNNNPTPIYFLTIPPGACFAFHVRLSHAAKVPAEIARSWRGLVEAAFMHAFEWLGFGAKTGAGFGALERDEGAARKRSEERAKAEEERRQRDEAERAEARKTEEQALLAKLSPLERLCRDLESAGEQRIDEIYRQNLMALSVDDQIRLGRSLKGAYIRIGKWTKEVSKKQKEKVATIKKILGEQ
jgi:CRISPR-associated protein Cmr6